ERRAVEVDGAQPALHRFDRVSRRAMGCEQIHPGMREHVGVDVYDGSAHQSRVTFAVLITSAHLRISAWMKAANSCGVLPIGSAPAAIARSRNSGAASDSTVVRFRRSITSRGVAAGSTRPNQPIAAGAEP